MHRAGKFPLWLLINVNRRDDQDAKALLNEPYEGQHYRSLTVIAERITGAHWSGPRFFGLTKRTVASVSAEAGE